MYSLSMYDLVALNSEIKVDRLIDDEKILLPKGLIGTIVEDYNNGEAFEVEFSNQDGQAYALVTLKPSQLVVLSEKQKESPFKKFIGILSDEEAQEIQSSIKENW